jgi:hypothetical protein
MTDIARALSGADFANNDISLCPIPAGLGWDSASYPVVLGYRDLGGGNRKGFVTGYTPFDGTAGTPYYQCRNGNQYYVDPAAGNDSTGAGTLANPYKTRDKAVTINNAISNPAPAATFWVKASAQITRTTGGVWAVVPTGPAAFVAWGGTVITGAFDNYTFAADSTYAWIFRAARTLVAGVYDRFRFDRFGNFNSYIQVASLAACSRIPGSWFQDTSDVVVHPVDEVLPTSASILVCVQSTGNNSGMEWTYGSAPQHVFFDRDTVADGWEIRGYRLKIFAGAYGSAPTIMAKRGVSVKYAAFTAADTINGIQSDNWWGIDWNEECYVGKVGYDAYNRHNTLNAKPSFNLNLNCRADEPGASAINSVGSQNGETMHENCIGISVASDLNYARGGTIRNINTTKFLSHGSRIRGDRGDKELGGMGTIEVQTQDTAQIWLSECDIQPGTNGFALDGSNAVNAIQLRNMPSMRGRMNGTIGTWTS